jgi:hypothetical protein
MTDPTADRNEKLKSTMRDGNTGNLNTSGKDGVVVCAPNQSSGLSAALLVTSIPV